MWKRITTSVDTELLDWAKSNKIKVPTLIKEGVKHLRNCQNQGQKIEKLALLVQELTLKNASLERRVGKIQQTQWAVLPAKEVR